MQLSLRTLVSKAFDAANWVIIRTLSGVQVASNSLVGTKTELEARLLKCFMKRHELLVIGDRGEHFILHVRST